MLFFSIIVGNFQTAHRLSLSIIVLNSMSGEIIDKVFVNSDKRAYFSDE